MIYNIYTTKKFLFNPVRLKLCNMIGDSKSKQLYVYFHFSIFWREKGIIKQLKIMHNLNGDFEL